MTHSRPNLSTEYQPKGSARRPSDTLDRPVDSIDITPGHGDRQEAPPHKLDSATARIDEKGRAHPDADADM